MNSLVLRHAHPVFVLAVFLLPACTFDTTGLRETGQNNNNVNNNINNVNNVVCGNDLRETGEVCDGSDLAGQTCLSRGFDGGTLACAQDCGAFDTSACTGTGPVCGNGVVEAGEVCDGAELEGNTCVTQGYVSGELACADGCAAFDTTACQGQDPECGDDVKEGAEACDGTDLGDETCQSQGFAAGTLACLAGCVGFELSGCTHCGNGVINPGELCDGDALGTATCANQGFTGGGQLACGTDCLSFDFSGCLSQSCGNNVVEAPEPCDGANLNGQTCAGLGFLGGTLACNDGCTAFDTSGCTNCGNGALDTGETCDGAALAGQTCVTQGFAGGTLACNASCSGFVTTGCTMCGNGVINSGETCDGAALAGQTCETQGFAGGTLACNASCSGYVTTGCTMCGNGVVDFGETCDGAALDGETCASQGFAGGTLACNASCDAYVTTGCTMCGNGVINTGETCDGAALGGETCASQGFVGGTLACNASCSGYVTTGCSLCGNNTINSPEVCDGTDLGGRSCAWYGCRSGTLLCLDDCSAFNPADCYDNHDEDGDGIDDNCDNCPTWPNATQTDTDGDGLGDVCEITGVGLTQFPYWSPFVVAPTGFGAYGGTWAHATDSVGGTAGGGNGGNYLHTDVLSGAYTVETTFIYRANGAIGDNYAGVGLAGQVNAGNQLTSLFACTYERDSKQITIWEWSAATGYTYRGGSTITTSAGNANWRKVFASVNSGVLLCSYLDETGGAGAVTYTSATGVGTFNGRAGLRLYNETADFRSYIRYR